MFEIIPVIDLMGGVVVHARMGVRDAYKPIETPLCKGAKPLDIVRGLLSLHAFQTLYIADLDAIAGRAEHTRTLGEISATFPHLALWLDNGAADAARVASVLEAASQVSGGGGAVSRRSLVLGSETQTGVALVAQYANDPRVILSLDFRGDAFLGPPALIAAPALWPARVIAMTLAKVGSGAGPDFARLAAVKAAAGSRAVYAAGGLRHLADAQALQRAGIAGALVATALHDGRLTSDDLTSLSGQDAL